MSVREKRHSLVGVTAARATTVTVAVCDNRGHGHERIVLVFVLLPRHWYHQPRQAPLPYPPLPNPRGNAIRSRKLPSAFIACLG